MATTADCWTAALNAEVLTLLRDGATFADVARFSPTVLVTTPTVILNLARAATDQQTDIPAIPLIVLTGEPGGSIASTRRHIEERWTAHVVDVYAMTELGLLGASCATGSGVHLDETAFSVEAIAPDGEVPVADGDLAELVVSTLQPLSLPLERYRTGDLVRLSHAWCACGNPNVRAAGGILGRVSQRLVVRGVELLLPSIEQVVRRHPAVVDYALLVYNVGERCEVAVQLEPDPAIASESDLARVAAEVSEDLRRTLGLRLQIDLLTPGILSLQNQDAGRRARRLRRQ
ncbi:MAG TPA: hypothetical protein VGQ62_06790 [Chloroflexota bacterium]|nr:hypothetical protein [Chloroflexota bacterium]